jgi:hypothetical protein
MRITTDEENRKIALRFLKEMGLFSAWKKYVRNKDSIDATSWFKTKNASISSIFGRTTFTLFLRKKYGVTIPSRIICISDMFRQYVSETTDIDVARPHINPNIFSVDKLSKTITVNYEKN